MGDGLYTRREILFGAATGAALLWWPRARADGPTDRAPAAGAAGTVTIGGDLVVNRLGFGAMRITGPGIWGEPANRDEALRLLRRAVALGVDFIDTADAYGPEVSERLIAEALYPYPKGLVIATKGGLVRPGPSQWERDGRPQHLRSACEQSLERLRLERLDLYQLHAVDPKVPLEDSLGELRRLQQEGKIRHVGVSNFSLEQLQRARRIVPVVSVQNRYNVADRGSEDVLEYCTRGRIAFIPWSPLARAAQSAYLKTDGGRAFAAVAAAHRVSELQLAIAWLLAKSPVMLPIPGTSSIEHLGQNVAAAGLSLSAAELAAIG